MNEEPEIRSEIYSPVPRRVMRRDGVDDWPGGFNSNPWRWFNEVIGGTIVSLILCIIGFGLTKIPSVMTGNMSISVVGLALIFFGVPTCLIYSLGVFQLLQTMKYHYRLVEWGNPSTAVITDIPSDTSSRKWLTYQFEDQTNSFVEVCLDNPSIAMRYKDVGDRFPVLYLPANPKQSVPCEDLFFKAESDQDETASRSTRVNKSGVSPQAIFNGMVEPLLCLGVGVAQLFIGALILVLITGLVSFIPKILHLLVR